jgi:hypothetical protein
LTARGGWTTFKQNGMRSFLIIAIFFAVLFLVAFQKSPGLRETLRGWLVPAEDQERLDAYRQGKALFALNWEGGAPPRFEAWGDNTSEGAQEVSGYSWLAHGHASFRKGGAQERKTWCILFVIDHGDAYIRVSGDAADETLRLVNAGNYREAVAKYGATGNVSGAAAVVAKPAPGSWMWDKSAHSPFDQPPSAGRKH